VDTFFRGDLAAPGGRRLAWLDSLLTDHAVFRLVWGNARAVVPGRLYRSNHPTPARLRAMARRWHLRTVVNLRGPCGNGSDALSREAASRLGLRFVDAPIASRTPGRADLLALIETLQTMAEPALIHCKSGADRAGFAAAVFLILNGASVARAMAELSWRYGHFRTSRVGILDALLLLYARDGEGRRSFPDWVRDEYDEMALRRAFAAHGLASFVVDRVLRRE
jgi:protein tyrosine/serine phosphatase